MNDTKISEIYSPLSISLLFTLTGADCARHDHVQGQQLRHTARDLNICTSQSAYIHPTFWRNATTMISTANTSGTPDGRRQAVPEASGNRVVAKPVPDAQARDPRRYQLDQLKRRFSPQQTNLQNGAALLAFHLKPSDPDFPFDLDFLQCELQVPASYPDPGVTPTLNVKNKDIPRGFAANIEQGWDRLARDRGESTLLALTNALDKNLETFLSEKKQDTVKLMSFRDTRHLEAEATTLGKQQPPVRGVQEHTGPVPLPIKRYIPEPSYSKDDINAARARRAQETKQLEARMSRLSMYQRSSDGVVYTLPLEPRRRAELPAGLQAIQSAQLIVPLLYPLQPLRILLNDVESKNAEAVEELFTKRASQQIQMSLMSHINFLSQNIHLMARQAQQQEAKERQEAAAAVKAAEGAEISTTAPADTPAEKSGDGKRHIQVIPRPPEWIWIDKADDTESSDDSWDEFDSDEGGAAIGNDSQGPHAMPLHQPERGTAISFPSIQLHGIELFQIALLSLSVKCERCRTINDVAGLRPGLEKASSCKKCATPFTTAFRPEMVHQSSTRAGFIDVSGCTVADMLPRFVDSCTMHLLMVKNLTNHLQIVLLSQHAQPAQPQAPVLSRFGAMLQTTSAANVTANSASRFPMSSFSPSLMARPCHLPPDLDVNSKSSVCTSARSYLIAAAAPTTSDHTAGSASRVAARYTLVTSVTM